jgi:DNA primase
MTDIADIKNRLDIVDVVSTYVELRQTGKNFRSPCPFHSERTPSFIVSPETQSWRCFGACATGGDVLSFVQKAEGLDFGATLRLVAEQLGIELSSTQSSSQPKNSELLYAINEASMRFYSATLQEPLGLNALAYLHDRGLSDQTIEEFHLGYSPSEPRILVTHLIDSGFSYDILAAAGLISGTTDNMREVFRNRLMFPIMDVRGRVVGFGGRQLSNNGPKYMNTPRTEVFDKSSILFGLGQAASTIRSDGAAVIVEGYMDAITAHQFGSTNVVASMGTAITQPQLDSLINIASTVIFALDADTAGQNATLQKLSDALTSFQNLQTKSMVRSTKSSTIFSTPKKQMAFRVISLPQGFDPDTLIRDDTAKWEQLLAESQPLLDRLFDEISKQSETQSSSGKAALAEKLLPLIYSSVDNFIDQDRYFQLLAKVLGVSRSTLQASTSHPKARTSSPRDNTNQKRFVTAPNAFTTSDSNFTENYCLGLILKYPELKDLTLQHDLSDVLSSENQALFTVYQENDTIERLQYEVQGTPLQPHLEKLISIKIPPLEPTERTQALTQILRTLHENHLRKIKRLESEMSSGEIHADQESVHSFDQNALNTNEKLRRLFNEKNRRS